MTEKSSKEIEMPRAHLIHFLSAVGIISILIIDAAIFNFSTQVLSFIPLVIRIVLCGIALAFAILFVIRAHNALFSDKDEPPSHLVTDGILNQVRNPMYLGILLLHLAFILLTMSLIGLGAWIVVVIIYDKLASYEEEVLEELFGEEYRDYKSRTSKWIPH